MSSLIARVRVGGVAWLTALVVCFAASAASAETLLMPKRDMLANVAGGEVVWGITTQANGTAFLIDYGDGTTSAGADCGADTVGDRSYIACNHNYVLANTYTVKLCVGPGAALPACPGELATVDVNVYNGPALAPEALRNLNVNRAIQDGLRYLWTSQTNRTTFDTTIETAWGNFVLPFTSLAVLAFENHGYRLPNNNNVPEGIYPKYAVRRGLNYVLARLTSITIGMTPAGNDPCVSVPAPVCSALYATTTGDPGYENALAILPFAGSGALSRTVTEVAAANVNGKSLGEVLQRMVNATSWGQNDSSTGRGGWYYTFNSTSSDGSTVGWDMLAILDASAAGANVPAWVKAEWSAPAQALANALNDNGSFDYQANANRASYSSVNVAKAGVGVQGMFYAGRPNTDPDFLLAMTYISDRWNNQALGQSFICGNSTYNKGCAYGMFNVFKGLKLYGVQTLPGVNRLAGPGTIPANDWYADYVDWLIANQTVPTSPTGGYWNVLYFSSQTTNEPSEAALALLMLSPVTLVLPDPDRFGTVGLSPQTDTNPVGTSHTVTAKAESGGNPPQPIAGATVNFQVLTGPNAGKIGTGQTNANGETTFTYQDTGGPAGGTDRIQAFIGALGSNIVQKIWQSQNVPRCDTEPDGDVDMADLVTIRNANGQMASGPTDQRDGNGDGRINVADVRYCQLRLTAAPN